MRDFKPLSGEDQKNRCPGATLRGLRPRIRTASSRWWFCAGKAAQGVVRSCSGPDCPTQAKSGLEWATGQRLKLPVAVWYVKLRWGVSTRAFALAQHDSASDS